MDVDVQPVTPDRWDDLVALFGTSRVMSECWCMWPRLERGSYSPGDPANEQRMCELVAAGAVPGVVATLDGRPVGWAALGPRSTFPQYAAPEAPDDEWAIACVFVRDDVRGRGVVRALIDGALARAAALGARTVDGPPPWWLPGDDAAIAAVRDAFLSAGFDEIGPGARMPVLRRNVN